MSETFLIKKTAFSDTALIAEREANSFVIGPGELNGPAGIARNSDLKLYGFGALKWGEGVDQNIFRVLENNACPAKELNDYNPDTGNFDYNPGTDPILPKDENDLGVGNGITVPVIGQQWFNTSDDVIYYYSSTGWQTFLSAGGALVITGTLNMNSNKIEGLADPDSADDAVNLGYADARYVNVTGDTMTSFLTLHADPTSALHAATKQYVDNHTPIAHTHTASNVTDFTEAAQDAIGAAIAAGTQTNITVTYNDSLNKIDFIAGAGGVSDHGALTGLADDDHTQYHNNLRGDARYYTQSQLNVGQLDSRYYTETEIDALFSAGAQANAWVVYDGTGSGAVLDSFNVSSVTKLGTGRFQVNFTTAFSNANYASVWSANYYGVTNQHIYTSVESQTTGSSIVNVRSGVTTYALYDPSAIYAIFMGD